MKRVFFAVVIWVVLVGGLYEYMRRRDATPVARPVGAAESLAGGEYALELTASFVPEPDPYAFKAGSENVPAIFARLHGQDVIARTDGVQAGIPLLADTVPGVIGGENEIVIAASPSVSGSPGRHFLQARVLRNGVPIASETFWADGSARVNGVLRFTAPAQSPQGAEARHGE